VNDQFKAIIQVAYEMAQANKQLQSEIKKVQEQYKIKFNAEIDSKTATASIKEIQHAQEQFNKKNLSAIDLEIKQRNEQAKVFSNQIKSQMQERISTEKQIQTELKKTALEQQKSTTLKYDKNILDNQITTYLRENTKLSDDFVKRLNSIQNGLSDVDTTGLKNLRKEFTNIKSEVTSLGQSGKTVFQQFKSDLGNFTTFFSAAGAVMLGINSMRKMVDNVYELDKQLVELSKVTDLTASGLKNVTDQAFALGEQVGKTGTTTLSAITDFVRAGYDLQDALNLSKQALMMVNVSENIEDAGIAAEDLVHILNGLGEGAEYASTIVDAINEVSNTQAVDFDNLVDGATRLSAVADQAGVSFEQMLGILTAGYSTLGDMEKVASGAITIFTRLQSVQLDGEEQVETVAKLQKDFSNATNGVVNIVDKTTGQLRSAYDILNDLDAVWGDLDKNTQEALAFEAAGTRQKNVLLSILQNWDMVKESVKSASDSMGSAAKENKKYLDSIAGRTEAFSSQFEQLSKNTINSEWIKNIVSFGTEVLKLVNNLGTLNTVLGVAGVVAIAKFYKSLDILKLKSLEASGMLVGLTEAEIANASSTVGLTAALDGLKVAFLSNPLFLIGTVVAGLFAFKTVIDENVKSSDELISKVNELRTETENLSNEYDSLSARDDLTEAEKNRLGLLQAQIEANKILIKQETERAYAVYQAEQKTRTTSDDAYAARTGNKAPTPLTTDVDKSSVEDMIKAYQELEKTKSTSIEQDDKIIAKKAELKGALASAAQNLESYKESGIELSEADTEFLNQIYKITNALTEQGIEAEKASSKFSGSLASMFTDEDISKTIDNFQSSMSTIKESLSDVSSLSSSDLIDLRQQFADFDWEKYGVTGEKGIGDITSALKDLAAEQYNTITSTVGQSNAFKSLYDDAVNLSTSIGTVSSAIDSLNTFDNALNSLDSAYANLIDKQSITISDIESLNKAFGNTPGFDKFIKNISSANSVTGDVQKSINDLVTTYLNTSGVLDNLNDSTKDLIITQLQHIGISNAEEIVTEKLAQQKAILAETGLDVRNATAEEIVELLNEQNVSDDTRIALLNLATQKMGVNNVALSTSGDIANLLSLMSVAKATSEQLQILEAYKSGKVGMGGTRPEDFASILNKAQAEVDAFYAGLGGNKTNVNYAGGSKTTSNIEKANKAAEKSAKEYSQELDLTAQKAKVLQNEIDNLNSRLKNTSAVKSQIDIYNKLIQKQSELASAYRKTADVYQKQYNKALSKLSKSDQSKVKNGSYSIEQFSGTGENSKDEKRYNAIQDAIELRDKLADTNSSVQDSFAQLKSYSTELADIPWDVASTKVDKINSNIDLLNEKLVNTTDYEKRNKLLDQILSNEKKIVDLYAGAIDETEGNIDSLYGKINSKYRVNSDKKAVKSGTRISTDGITDPTQLTYIVQYNRQIAELEENTVKLAIEQEKYKGYVNDTKLQKFQDAVALSDKLLDTFDKLDEEVQGSLDFVDDNSVEQIALFQTGLNNARNNVTALKSEIEKLNALYASGSVGIDDYNARLSDLQSQLTDAGKTAKSYYDDIVEAMKARYDEEKQESEDTLNQVLDDLDEKHDATIDNLNDELDAYKKIIDAKRESLEEDKEAYEYQKSISEKTENIADIQSRMAELQRAANTGDRAAAKELSELQDSLAEAQSDLDDTQYEHKLDLEEDALDDSLNNYEDLINSKIDKENDLYERLKQNAQDEYDDKLAKINSLYESESELIKQAAELTSSQFGKVLDDINSRLQEFGLSMSSDLTDALNSTNKSNSSSSGSSKSSSNNKVTAIIGNGGVVTKTYSSNSKASDLNKYLASQGYNTLDEEGIIDLAHALGINDIQELYDVGNDKVGMANKNRILAELKKAGFKTGGTVDASNIKSSFFKDLIKSVGEDGLALVKHGDEYFTDEKASLVRDLIKNIEPLNNLTKLTTPNIDTSLLTNKTSNSVVVKFDSLVNVGNVSSDFDIISEVKSNASKITEIITKQINSLK
jgi:TP901 family phage tail tape measure protein